MEASATLNRRQRRSALNMPRKHNNRKTGDSRKIQLIYTEPPRLLISRYLTNSAKQKAQLERLSMDEALAKYGKNRYAKNPDAKVSKIIIHSI